MKSFILCISICSSSITLILSPRPRPAPQTQHNRIKEGKGSRSPPTLHYPSNATSIPTTQRGRTYQQKHHHQLCQLPQQARLLLPHSRSLTGTCRFTSMRLSRTKTVEVAFTWTATTYSVRLGKFCVASSSSTQGQRISCRMRTGASAWGKVYNSTPVGRQRISTVEERMSIWIDIK